MTARAGSEPVVRQKARMPPSTIPPAQVQAIIAELRASDFHPDVPREYAEKPRDPWRGRAFAAAGLLMVGVIIGAGVGILGPAFGLFHHKTAKAAAPIAMVVSAP